MSSPRQTSGKSSTTIPPLVDDDAELFDPTGKISLSAGSANRIKSLEKSRNRYRILFFALLVFTTGFVGFQWWRQDLSLLSLRSFSISSPAPAYLPGLSGNPGTYPPELLTAMGARLRELGYPALSAQELAALRDRNVTATFVGQMRALGYALTLQEAARLAQRSVTAQFVSMMKELGYSLSIDEMIRLRDNDVTANFTARLANAGLSGLSLDQLVRLKSVGVNESSIQRFLSRFGRTPTVDELIRFHISNQG